MKTQVSTELSDYLQSISQRVSIEIPTVSGLSPYFTNQEFKYLSLAHNSSFGNFYISTKGVWADSVTAIDYSNELIEASKIVSELNRLYKPLK